MDVALGMLFVTLHTTHPSFRMYGLLMGCYKTVREIVRVSVSFLVHPSHFDTQQISTIFYQLLVLVGFIYFPRASLKIAVIRDQKPAEG